MKQPHREKSVQCDLLHVRETSGDMLCLATPGSPTQRSYRAVLEVFPINLALKAQEEQEAIIERFGALIRSLSFPLQVLVRNQRLDLLPYIRRFLTRPQNTTAHPSTADALARSVAELVQQIAAQRTLIERHVYVIIPTAPRASRARRRGGFPALSGTRRMQRLAETQEQARQELALRAEALTQHLASCGLACRRLRNDDLARLYYRCLTPTRGKQSGAGTTVQRVCLRSTRPSAPCRCLMCSTWSICSPRNVSRSPPTRCGSGRSTPAAWR